MFLKPQPIEDTLCEYIGNLNIQLAVKTQRLYERAAKSVAMSKYLRVLLIHIAKHKITASLSTDDKLYPAVLVPVDAPFGSLVGVVHDGEIEMIISACPTNRSLLVNFYENHDSKGQAEILAIG